MLERIVPSNRSTVWGETIICPTPVPRAWPARAAISAVSASGCSVTMQVSEPKVVVKSTVRSSPTLQSRILIASLVIATVGAVAWLSAVAAAVGAVTSPSMSVRSWEIRSAGTVGFGKETDDLCQGSHRFGEECGHTEDADERTDAHLSLDEAQTGDDEDDREHDRHDQGPETGESSGPLAGGDAGCKAASVRGVTVAAHSPGFSAHGLDHAQAVHEVGG